MAIDTRNPLKVSAQEEAAVRALDYFLRAHAAPRRTARLVAPNGEELELPAAAYEALRQAVHLLARGQIVTIVPHDKLLTTQDAADILNVSRPYLVKLLKDGVVPYVNVGTHRRIRFDDLMRFKTLRDARRREGLKRLTALSEEMGLYDIGEVPIEDTSEG